MANLLSKIKERINSFTGKQPSVKKLKTETVMITIPKRKKAHRKSTKLARPWKNKCKFPMRIPDFIKTSDRPK